METGSRDHSAHLWLVRRPVPPPAGAMTLKQLNDRLEAYINGIGLSPEGPNVSIAVDRISEGGSFNIHDMPQWAEYQQMVRATSNTNISCLYFRYFFIQLKIFFQCKAYEDQEEELARVEAEIAILTHDNQDYQERLRNMQIRIEEKKREISDLEIKIRDYEYKKKVRRIWNFIVLILIH